MKGCDEKKLSTKSKEITIMFIQRFNLLSLMISLMIDDNLKVTQKGTLA